MRLRLGLAAGLGLLVAGCIAHDVHIGREFAPATQPATMDYADWSLVLNRSLRMGDTKRPLLPGEVDYLSTRMRPEPLLKFLARLAVAGPSTRPELFDRPADRIAYYINAYNAAVMYGIAAQAKDGAVPKLLPRSPTNGYRFMIDGAWRTPDELRRLATAESKGDWRVALAMSTGRRSDPRPAARPFVGDVLEYQLQEFAVDSFGDPAVIRVDAGLQYLCLHPALYRERPRLIESYQKRTGARNAEFLAVLLDMARPDQYPLLNSAVGYAVVESPVNPAVNAASAAKAPEPGLFSKLFGGI